MLIEVTSHDSFRHHAVVEPSPWLCRWAELIAPGASVLDVACGAGRHLRWLAKRGFAVTGVDRDAVALAGLAEVGTVVKADIEHGPWPLSGRTFGAVVVTNYLWRPLFPTLLASVAPGGVLIYETFAAGNETLGPPSRPDFLLRHGELLDICAAPGWRMVAYEDGFLSAPGRFMQRCAAVRDGGARSELSPRYRLQQPQLLE